MENSAIYMRGVNSKTDIWMFQRGQCPLNRLEIIAKEQILEDYFGIGAFTLDHKLKAHQKRKIFE